MVGGRDGDAALVVTVGVEERDGAGEVEVGAQVEHSRGTQRAEVNSAHLVTVRAALVSHPQLHQVVVRHCRGRERGEALKGE